VGGWRFLIVYLHSTMLIHVDIHFCLPNLVSINYFFNYKAASISILYFLIFGFVIWAYVVSWFTKIVFPKDSMICSERLRMGVFEDNGLGFWRGQSWKKSVNFLSLVTRVPEEMNVLIVLLESLLWKVIDNGPS
jgi:hypothetical protein